LSLPDLVPTLITQDVHPPLYFFLLHFWVQWVGHSEFAVRLLSVFMGGLTVPLVYRIGRMVFNSRAGGLAALLLTISQFHVYYSQETRAYSLFTWWATLSFFIFLRWQHNPKISLTLAYVGTSTLLLYVHTYGFFVLAAQNLCWLIGWARTRAGASWRRWALMQVSVLILFAPWGQILLAKVSQAQCFYCLEPSLGSVLVIFYQYLGSPWSFGLALAALAVRGYEGLRARFVRAPNGLAGLTAPVPGFLLAGVWVASLHVWPILLSALYTTVYLSRATLHAVPAFLILLGGALAGLRQSLLRIGLTTALILAHLATLAGYYGSTIRQQWREVGQRLGMEAQPGDLVLLYPSYAAVGFDYYVTRSDLVSHPLAESETQPQADWSGLWSGASRVWIVVLERPDLLPMFQSKLEPAYHLVLTHSYVGVDLYLFEQRP
jgi:uncharacterized membrane protein